MGSGNGGAYSTNNSRASQPYADNYNVVDSELKKDKADKDIYNPSTGYFKNPNAKTLEAALGNNDRIYSGNNKANGDITYVLNENGQIIFGKRENPNNSKKRSPHPTLIGGKSPKVQCAGMITFRKGQIVSVNNESGHYKPNKKSMSKVYKALEKFKSNHPNAFSPKYKGGN